MIGFSAAFYLACDGEDLLGERYDGNACELVSRDYEADNESQDRSDDAAFPVGILESVASAMRLAVFTPGWRTIRFEPGQPPRFLCPRCAAREVEARR